MNMAFLLRQHLSPETRVIHSLFIALSIDWLASRNLLHLEAKQLLLQKEQDKANYEDSRGPPNVRQYILKVMGKAVN